VFVDEPQFSLIDFGCGYGAYATYLSERRHDVRYIGYDFSAAMIAEARTSLVNKAGFQFTTHEEDLVPADFVVASGLMNVRLDCPADDWRTYILATLDRFNALSKRGYSFNALTKYSDADRMRPDLYYADPCDLFDYCKRNHSRYVALLHDYPLYEFTVLVKK
jgi:SAM-dependent methyltransferase